MVFSSLTFLFLFLPAVIACYYLLPGVRAKNAVLCLFSLLFYAWGEPVYVLLMAASILLNYLAGLGMERFPRRKKLLLLLALLFNLGAIGVFKYAGFFLSGVSSLFALNLPVLRIALPIGISFYTFQILSYVIDVYHGRVAAQRSLLSLATYITMFPQLVAGPIVRYDTVREELRRRCVTVNDFAEGLCRFFFGLDFLRLGRNHHVAIFSLKLGVHAFDQGFETVDLVLDVVAELEGRNHTFFDKHGFAGAGIAGRTSLARLAAESAETTNLDGVAFDQLFAQKVEKLLDDGLNIVAHKSGGLGDFLNQCLFSYICHGLNIGLSMS